VILIDSNVLIDVLGSEGEWKAWSTDAVTLAGADDDLAITPIVVAEVAPQAGSLVAFLEGISGFGVTVAELGNEAAFASGLAFNAYRARRRSASEPSRSIIADFLIGGQALVTNATILTRDPRFYRSYFPTVPLIAPETTEP
jgi:predicted nucleic acid-binding protein